MGRRKRKERREGEGWEGRGRKQGWEEEVREEIGRGEERGEGVST